MTNNVSGSSDKLAKEDIAVELHQNESFLAPNKRADLPDVSGKLLLTNISNTKERISQSIAEIRAESHETKETPLVGESMFSKNEVCVDKIGKSDTEEEIHLHQEMIDTGKRFQIFLYALKKPKIRKLFQFIPSSILEKISAGTFVSSIGMLEFPMISRALGIQSYVPIEVLLNSTNIAIFLYGIMNLAVLAYFGKYLTSYLPYGKYSIIEIDEATKSIHLHFQRNLQELLDGGGTASIKTIREVSDEIVDYITAYKYSELEEFELLRKQTHSVVLESWLLESDALRKWVIRKLQKHFGDDVVDETSKTKAVEKISKIKAVAIVGVRGWAEFKKVGIRAIFADISKLGTVVGNTLQFSKTLSNASTGKIVIYNKPTVSQDVFPKNSE